MLKAGKLRHRITIQAPNFAKDGNGQNIPTWAPIASTPTVWAAIEPVSSNEEFTSQEVEATATHKITLRYRGDLSATYRFSFADPGTGKTRIFILLGTPCAHRTNSASSSNATWRSRLA